MSCEGYIGIGIIIVAMIGLEWLIARRFPRLHKSIRLRMKSKARLISCFGAAGLCLAVIGAYWRIQFLFVVGAAVLGLSVMFLGFGVMFIGDNDKDRKRLG